jgi:hypothetical protein
VAKQLMIYEKIQPLSSELHRNYAVQVDNYKFAESLISVPILANEIAFAANDFPIVFSATGVEGEYIPLAMMGLKSGENLFINEQGQFTTRYIPGFFRRYPFVLSGDKANDAMTLCIDDESTFVYKDGAKGNRLFDDAGQQSLYLKEVLEFLKDYHVRAEMTQTFCKRLHELDLLEPMQANITFNGHPEANINLTGFFAVKREKLKALSDADALDLFKKDGMELIYSHLQSMANLNDLIKTMSARLDATK